MTIRRLLTLITACILSGHAIADNSYGTNPAAIKMMQELAARDGYDADYLQALLLAVGRDDGVLAKISKPAEKTKPWYEYRKIFEDQARTDDGVAFWDANAATLARAEAQYGVDPAIIVRRRNPLWKSHGHYSRMAIATDLVY